MEDPIFFLANLPPPHLAWGTDVEHEQSFLDRGLREMEGHFEYSASKYTNPIFKHMYPLPKNKKLLLYIPAQTSGRTF